MVSDFGSVMEWSEITRVMWLNRFYCILNFLLALIQILFNLVEKIR